MLFYNFMKMGIGHLINRRTKFGDTTARLGTVWYTLFCHSFLRFGMVDPLWYRLVRFSTVWYGLFVCTG